jgi:hypothetical protein
MGIVIQSECMNKKEMHLSARLFRRDPAAGMSLLRTSQALDLPNDAKNELWHGVFSLYYSSQHIIIKL